VTQGFVSAGAELQAASSDVQQGRGTAWADKWYAGLRGTF
jgi:hypothetical protein